LYEAELWKKAGVDGDSEMDLSDDINDDCFELVILKNGDKKGKMQ